MKILAKNLVWKRKNLPLRCFHFPPAENIKKIQYHIDIILLKNEYISDILSIPYLFGQFG